MKRSQQHTSRRDVLTGAIAAGGVLASTSLAAQQRSSLDRTGAAADLRTYMLLRGALDEALVISCIECQYFGVVDGTMTPFYDLAAVTFSRFRKARAGGYDAVSHEIEYFIDPATGDVLDQWRNPYSGKTVTAKHADSVPVRYSIGADRRLELPPVLLYAGSDVSRATPSIETMGDNVWAKERTVATIPVAGGKPIHFNEAITYHARVSDIAPAGVTRVASDASYLGISSFRPWQEMGDRPGHMVGYGIGGSGLTLADVPPRWIAITKRRHPEAFTNPGAYLDPLWNTL